MSFVYFGFLVHFTYLFSFVLSFVFIFSHLPVYEGSFMVIIRTAVLYFVTIQIFQPFT